MLCFLCFFAVLLPLRVSENSTKITVEFGQNVTLNCSLAQEEIYWFIIQRRSERPLHILRSFIYGTSQYNHQHQEFKNKYSLQNLNRLFIHSITKNELGLYYCATPDDPPIFSNVITVIEKANTSVPSVPCDRMVVNEEDYLKSWTFPPFVVSCFLNIVFVILLLVAITRYCIKKRRSRSVEEPCQHDSPVYSDINLSTNHQPTRPVQIQYTASPYAVVRLPAPGQQIPRVKCETTRISTDGNQVC
ncbi:hypothetical protein ACEWY4_016611 [Coilia grayii]|uniref:Immunoglobulin domain-containing protein n=1 Tax=Coilia grayii TaxID=363190 RepID=A0ABD1JPA4_9TELE